MKQYEFDSRYKQKHSYKYQAIVTLDIIVSSLIRLFTWQHID